MMNLTLLTDFYELTMANGYLEQGQAEKIAYFDMFFRRVPDGGGLAIMCGVDQLIEYLQELTFTDEDIAYLESKEIFSPEFLDYLRNFKFECDVWCVPEGTPIFPGEPILTVRGPIIQAQFIETMVLLVINHQSLICTKANRICRSAEGRPVLEFGSRRAQSSGAAILGARAAYIGGCSGTACTLSDREYGIPALGTMAHSWVQTFPSEYEAFCAYARTYPHACTLLIDTYNVLKSGVPNAIRCFDEILKPLGARPAGVRIDSGDLGWLSKEVRRMLDEAGYPDCKICVSNSLDEYVIRELIRDGAPIDSFGVGERLITSQSEPIFGGVYKLCAIEHQDGTIEPKIKLSENIGKINNPGVKELWRLYDNQTGKALADVITLADEVIDDSQDYEIFDPENTWKRKDVYDFHAKKLRVKLFEKGQLVCERKTTQEIQAYCKEQVATMWDSVLRFENPHKYYVDLSQKLYDLKWNLLREGSKSKR
ncbi:MAG: nicotinate phosphoribosyltransferase [Clostridia bacterium]|nr:nicotinate phosphoribosyltransferase [Clostridia bacterium]